MMMMMMMLVVFGTAILRPTLEIARNSYHIFMSCILSRPVAISIVPQIHRITRLSTFRRS